jgi:uncharacterized protein YbjT (DUF2867 family)
VKVVVIGGRGLLGSHLNPILEASGHQTVAASRSGDVKVDLETGEGLAEALQGSDVVVHLASNPKRPKTIDIEGTSRLLSAMDSQHLVYVSIVGVDRHPFVYYKAKHTAEQAIMASGVSYSILRATQFHDFVAFFVGAACRPPVALIPKSFVFQPIDVDEVATAVADLVETRAHGLQADLAGPTVHKADYLAKSLMKSKGKVKPTLNLPVPGKSAAAFRAGVHTNPRRAVGVRTWEAFLAGEQRQ